MFTTLNEFHWEHNIVATLNQRQSNDVDSTSQQRREPGGKPEQIHASMVILQPQCKVYKSRNINVF